MERGPDGMTPGRRAVGQIEFGDRSAIELQVDSNRFTRRERSLKLARAFCPDNSGGEGMRREREVGRAASGWGFRTLPKARKADGMVLVRAPERYEEMDEADDLVSAVYEVEGEEGACGGRAVVDDDDARPLFPEDKDDDQDARPKLEAQKRKCACATCKAAKK